MEQPHKAHRTHQSGASAKKKAKSDKNKQHKKQNHKASAFISSMKAKRLQSLTVEKEQRRLHIPTIDRSYSEPPPYVVVVQGPPQVDKSLLIKSLIKHYIKHNVPEVQGPITIVSGMQRRLQFVECLNDVNGKTDCSKIADLALLLINGSYGFEMVHIAGVGDYSLAGVTGLADPCPLPSTAKKKRLCDKEKPFYAPISGLGDLLYDKYAVYININDHFVQFSKVNDGNGKTDRKGRDQDVGETLVTLLQNTKFSIDEKLEKSSISHFSWKLNVSSDATINAKDTDDDAVYIHDKQYQTVEGTAGRLGEIHFDEDMDGSESNKVADVKKGETIKSGSESDEDNLVEQVEI